MTPSPYSLELPIVRTDTLPEHTRYIDDGCEVSRTCLECPLHVCRYDEPIHIDDRAERDDRIFKLRKDGVPIPELARAFDISTRSVQRIIQRGGRSGAAASRDRIGYGPATLHPVDFARRREAQPNGYPTGWRKAVTG